MELFNTYTQISDSDIVHSNIEYKELNTEDFEGLDKPKKDTLDIDDDEYISEKAWNYIDLDEHNTVVINASVGQGKSHLARLIAKKYYMARDEEGVPLYTVIFAVPYKSLIGQYVDEIIQDLEEEGVDDVVIPDYSKLVEYDEETYIKLDVETENRIKFKEKIEEASSHRLHIITINCLLGNPGDNAIEQSKDKQAYLRRTIEKCRDEGRKIVLLVDEIHDAIHNFEQDLIFNLWKFRTNFVLHKTFILSATFNEASKIVIKYFAELTSKKLHIIETKRKQIIKDQSKLHIHVTNEDYYNLDSDEFQELFGRIIEKHDTLNILSYSRKLCTDIADGSNGISIRKLLIDKYGERINICVPDNYHPNYYKRKEIPQEISYNEKYQKGMCNIGTTFKTGISIKENNSGFIVILPNAKASQGFWTKESFGIFNNGVIALIQALARVRNKSDIYVIMPFPLKYIQTEPSPYFTSDNYMIKLNDINIFKHRVITHSDKYYQLYLEYDKLIRKKYDSLRELVSKEIKMVAELEKANMRQQLPDLTYPTLEQFILEKGELYLYSKFAICGKDLSAYMIWAAFHNQFVNCKLVEVTSSKIKEDKYIDNVQVFLFLYFIHSDRINPTNTMATDIELYNSIFKHIDSSYEMYITVTNKEDEEESKLVSKDKLRKHIMVFIQKFFKGNKRINSKYIQMTVHEKDNGFELTDDEFTREDYLLCSIANSLIYNESKDELTPNTKDNNLIEAYNNLNNVRDIFIKKLRLSTESLENQEAYHDEIGYIYPTIKGYVNNPLSEDDMNLIIETFELINKDANFKVFGKNGVNLKDRDCII